MNFEHYHIYVVEGPAQRLTCDDFLTEYKASGEAKDGFAKANGGIGVFGGSSITGIIAKPNKPVSPGWKRTTKNGYTFDSGWSYIPDRKTREGKSHAKAMQALKVLTSSDCAARIFSGSTVVRPMGSGRFGVMRPQCYQEGPHWILLVPINGDKPAPTIDGCRLLKLSEFYAMKETVAA